MVVQKFTRIALIFLFLSILISLLYLLGQAAPVTANSIIGTTNVKLVSSSATGVEFTLETAAFSQSLTGTIELAGLEERVSQAGAPALPYFATTLILPPEAEVMVSVTESAVSTRQVTAIPPVAGLDLAAMTRVDNGISPYAVLDEAGQTISYALPPLVNVVDAAVYEQDGLFPAVNYEISEPGYLRDFRLVELHLYPLRYNPTSGELRQAQAMQVQVSFLGAQLGHLRPAPSYLDSFKQSLSDQALNYQQGQHWRSLPQHVQEASGTELPLGTDVYKIELNQDGIYELTGADFAAAGMDTASVNPNTLQMLYRGQPMAYQLIGDDGDSQFDPTEKIRFYGWAFDGPRTDKQFVSNNILWVWAGGTPTIMSSRPNETSMGYPVDTNYLAEITREPENNFFATWQRWDTFPNEPDAWFWDYVNKPFATLTRTYTLTLHHPEPTGSQATYLLEYNTRRNLTTQPHIVRTRINNNPNLATFMWQEPTIYHQTNINLTDTVPINDLLDGTNTVTVVYDTATTDQLYLNRITVEYLRQLVAVNDQLLFRDELGNGREFQVSSFTEGNVNNIFVWDVSVPTDTVEIQINSSDIVNNGGTFTYKIGSNHPAGSRFLATTASHILTVNDLANTITQYVPQNLDPPGGEADWLGISHSDFMTPTLQLAAHRADPTFGGMRTHVVDIADVINQYGYGLPLPQAIESYLRYGLGNWTIAPSYVALFGDATQNPRNLDCFAGCSVWDKDEVNFLLTDLPFVDRFQGLIPSDFPFTLLSGDDLLADMAIGRIAAKTEMEAASMVAKIIEFEINQFDPQNYEWQRNMLFVADNRDPNSGNFCYANQLTADVLPASFEQIHLCLPGEDPANPPTPQQVDAVRTAMSQTINVTGTTMLSYRGHGAIENWTGNGLLSAQMTDFWQNNGRPLMIISADCLDGHYAWPARQGLGEVFMKLDDRGSMAHWASSGLGLTSEHSILHSGFYNGVFAEGLTAIGDAVNYAKLVYINGGNHESEAYSFNLQGDPAMQLFRPDIAVDKQVVQPIVDPGELADFVLTVHSEGLVAAKAVVTDTLPPELNFVTMTTSLPTFTPNINGNQISVELVEPLNWGESATITLTTRTITNFIGVTTNWATAVSAGDDIDESDNTASATVTSTVPSVILTSYTALPLDNEVQLDWSVSAEFNIVGYKLLRSDENGPFLWLQNLGNNGVIPTQGSVPADYQAFDTTALNGHTYTYRLLALQTNMAEFSLGDRQVTLPPKAYLLAFNATPLNNEVPLDWQVSAELQVAAYTIERGQNGTFTWLQALGANGYISATGDINTAASYLVTDTTALNGQTYTYRLLAHESVLPGAMTAIVATRTVTLMDVDLVNFDASPLNNAAQLEWTTQSEIHVGAYRLERGENGVFTWLQELGDNGYISAMGGPSLAASYVMTDSTAVNGHTYDYRLIAVQAAPTILEQEVAEDTVTLDLFHSSFIPFLLRP